MAVRLFVGNLAYSTTEADLRSYFGTVAPPSQVVLPVDRETGRPRGFAFIEFQDRSHAEAAVQKFNGQIFNGRPLAVSEARAREDRGPGAPRPGGGFGGPRPGGPGGGFSGPRPAGSGFGGPRPGGGGFGGPRFDPSAPAPPRNRNFGPDAKPQRGTNAKAKKKEAERPRGPIPMKVTGRSFTLDDVDDAGSEEVPDIDDIATSKPAADDEEES
ncbi:MAG TPA: RNA-binding protein [Vicinamibacterales bacterium]|nr:RNA-binding protein [Vicinamibacterales bacterium]